VVHKENDASDSQFMMLFGRIWVNTPRRHKRRNESDLQGAQRRAFSRSRALDKTNTDVQSLVLKLERVVDGHQASATTRALPPGLE